MRMKQGLIWLVWALTSLTWRGEGWSAETPSEETLKGYSFQMVQSEGAPSPFKETLNVWVAGNRFRAETVGRAKPRVYLFDGQQFLTFWKGQSQGEPLSSGAARARSAWNPMYTKPPNWITITSKPSDQVEGTWCDVTVFTQKFYDRTTYLTEWKEPNSGIVLKRETKASNETGGRSLVCQSFKAVGIDTAKFRLPEGLEVSPPFVPKVGGPALDFDLDRFDTGETIHLGAYRGKSVVVLNFYHTHCGPCVGELPGFARVYREYKEKGVTFLCVNTSDGKSAKGLEAIGRVAKELGTEWPIVMDEPFLEVWKRYGYAAPTNVIIDRNGIIRFHIRGRLEEEELRKQLDRALKFL